MSTFQVHYKEMKEAENAATKAADNARGRGSSAHLTTVRGSIPGAKSVDYLDDLGTSWDDEIDAWADDADSFGASMAATSSDAQGTDGEAEGLFGELFGGLFGGN